MNTLSKKSIVEFLKGLTELTSKHNIIIGADFRDLVPDESIELQIGFNMAEQEYAGYTKLDYISASSQVVDEIEDAEFREIGEEESNI